MAYYVLDTGDNKIESMSKEQILAAITQAVENGTISDVDTGFVTTIKEQNHQQGLKFWYGTMAEFNALGSKQPNTFYIFSDDTTLQDIEDKFTTQQEFNNYVNVELGNLGNKKLYEHNFDVWILNAEQAQVHLYFRFVNQYASAYNVTQGSLFVTELINRKIKDCSGYVIQGSAKQPISYMECEYQESRGYIIRIYYINNDNLLDVEKAFSSSTTKAEVIMTDTVKCLNE